MGDASEEVAGRGGTRTIKKAANSGCLIRTQAVNGSQIANKIMKSHRKEIGMNAVRIFQFWDPYPSHPYPIYTSSDILGAAPSSIHIRSTHLG